MSTLSFDTGIDYRWGSNALFSFHWCSNNKINRKTKMKRLWYVTNYKQVRRTQRGKKLVSGKRKVKINIKIELSDEKNVIRLTFVDIE